MIETHCADAVAAIAQGRDLSRAGAAHQPHSAEVLLQGLAKGFEVVFRRAEEQHEAKVRVNELTREVLGHSLRLAGQGHGGDDTLCRFFEHPRPHSTSLFAMWKFYGGGPGRPILLG
ncbi:hypothetical protein D9M68_804060 [compost metagenome]